MGDTKGPPDPAGTLARMKKTFNHLVTTNSGRQGLQVFKGEVMKEWSELSKKLQPGSKLEERSSALAFVVRHCYILLDPKDFVGNTGLDDEHKALVRNILGVLHVCVDDHANYNPMPRECFKFYGDCLAAMDVFTKRAWSLCMTVGSDVNAHLALAGHLHFEMKQARDCMSRCWSVLRSKDGTLIVSPATGKEKSPTAFEADIQNQMSSLEKASQGTSIALGYVEATVKEFCKLALSFICVLSCNMLEGMRTTAELLVDKQAFDEKFNFCKKVFGGDKEASERKFDILRKELGVTTDDAQRAERTWESLRDIFNLVDERYADATNITTLQNAKAATQIPDKKFNEKLKRRLGSGTSSWKLKSIAAEVLSGGGLSNESSMKEYVPNLCTKFSACLLPASYVQQHFVSALHEGIAKVEGRTFVEDMYIEMKSRKEKIHSRDKQMQEKLLQDFAEDEKKTQGKHTPKKRAGPQSSFPAGPGQKNTSTPGSTSKSESELLGQKGKTDTAEGTLTSPGSKPVGGQEVANSADVAKLEDQGSHEEAHLTQGISSAAIGSVTPQALAGDPTREELEQAEKEFVSSCGLPPEMKVLQNAAQVEEHARAPYLCLPGEVLETVGSNLKALSDKVHLLGISQLCELGLHFYTGHSHPDPQLDRFTTDLPELVEFLAEAGKGSYTVLVEEIRYRLDCAQRMVAHVTDPENNTIRDLNDLGFDILRFTIAASQLSKVLLQNAQ